MQLDFFNTISAREPVLTRYKEDALSQERVILEAFGQVSAMTPLEAERRTGINHDSCKRAITNLVSKGKLVKLDEMVMESKGKKNHLWQKA